MATTDPTAQIDVVTAVTGDTCWYCDSGRLVEGTYKGKDAAICDNCETPQVQTW